MTGKTTIVLMLALALALALPPAARSAEAFGDSLPINVARVLLGNGAAMEANLDPGLPEGFPSFEPPPGYEIMAALAGPGQRVVILTGDEAGSAVEVLGESLASEGWIMLRRGFPGRGQGGFVAPNMPHFSDTLCHDDLGTMEISSKTYDDHSLVLLTRSDNQARMMAAPARQGGRQPTCAEQRSPGNRNAAQEFRQYMPRLVVPGDSRQGRRPSMMGGFSFSGNQGESRATLDSDWGIERVYSHFAGQIEESGWTPDTNWLGELTAGGSWTREAEDGLVLVGILNLVKSVDQEYDLRFTLINLE